MKRALGPWKGDEKARLGKWRGTENCEAEPGDKPSGKVDPDNRNIG